MKRHVVPVASRPTSLAEHISLSHFHMGAQLCVLILSTSEQLVVPESDEEKAAKTPSPYSQPSLKELTDLHSCIAGTHTHTHTLSFCSIQ